MGVTTAIIAAGAIGFGASQMFGAQDKKPELPAPPALPNQKNADQVAKEQTSAQRKMLLASGGMTDYTGGQGILGSGDTTKTTLLGN